MSDLNLQEQLDAAAPGALVRVPPGEHRANLFIDKPLTLLGEGAVLDGGREGPVVTVSARPGQEVRLIGLTLRNGAAHSGAGVFFRLGSLLIAECRITSNTAHVYGGGAIHAAGQTLRVERCQLTDNEGRQGGAVLLDEEVDATFASVLVAKNRARYGGGLRLKEGARCVAEGCTFADNEVAASGEGSQLYLSGTMTRAPRLELYNAILSGPKPVIVRHREHPGELLGARVLLPEGSALQGLADVIEAEPGFVGQGPSPYALRQDSPAAGRGDPARVISARDVIGHDRASPGGLALGAYALVG